MQSCVIKVVHTDVPEYPKVSPDNAQCTHFSVFIFRLSFWLGDSHRLNGHVIKTIISLTKLCAVDLKAVRQ